MGEFEGLCNLDVHEIPPQQIKALREKAHVSQAVFAAVLNTSPWIPRRGVCGVPRAEAALADDGFPGAGGDLHPRCHYGNPVVFGGPSRT
jgi:hypothetical protein